MEGTDKWNVGIVITIYGQSEFWNIVFFFNFIYLLFLPSSFHTFKMDNIIVELWLVIHVHEMIENLQSKGLAQYSNG